MTTHEPHALKELDRPAESEHARAVSALRSLSPDAGRSAIAEQLVSFVAPDSFVADQYRALRHNIELLRKESGLHLFAVTSPGPGDGKTITTLNLAGALAQNFDARVLVIDADLRRPKVADYLGLGSQHSPGLVDLIRDSSCDLDRVVRRLDGFNLMVLPAGVAQVSPYELLNSPRVEALLTEARRRYDWVIVDTPPIVAVPDGRLIGRWVDGFLIIIGAHRTPRKLVAEALDLVDPGKVIGIVFNGDDRPLSGRYGYYSHYYTSNAHRSSWWRRALKLDRRASRRSSR
ncbi:MAG TPA: CpsD/CapB family tyrosine-protein kinase [Vicinamibacterales bacterium]